MFRIFILTREVEEANTIMREFGLRVIQGPSGYDVRETIRRLEPHVR